MMSVSNSLIHSAKKYRFGFKPELMEAVVRLDREVIRPQYGDVSKHRSSGIPVLFDFELRE